MGTRLNTEFNYRYQVEGNTTWEKIKTLKGFLVGRKRAAALEECSKLKYQAKLAEYEHLKEVGALAHILLNLQAEIIETNSHLDDLAESFSVNHREIECLERLLAELYAEAEPTRIEGYDDDMMFEVNAANEFAVWVAKEIQAEIIANGRPSPAKLRNAMSNPYSFKALQQCGLIPEGAVLLEGNTDPLNIQIKSVGLPVYSIKNRREGGLVT